MYFDFEDGHPDLERVPSALNAREEVMATIIVHLLVIIVILLVPRLPYFQARALAARKAAEAQRLAMLEKQREQQRRFVFIQPRVELTPNKPPAPNAVLSDRDRSAATRERAPNPKNSQPFNRGNTPEYVEKSPPPSPPRQARQPGPPSPPTPEPAQTPPAQAADAGNRNALQLPDSLTSPPAARNGGSAGRPETGPLRDALQHLSKYAEQAAFDNPDGGGGINQFGFQFDSKGVDFGPWLRRFIAQIKSNWFVPYAAMSLRGHVVITFNVHKTGAITDLTVVGPSNVDSFNNAAFNALAASNPTEPLPPPYPSERAFFTVTFFYNERPPEGP